MNIKQFVEQSERDFDQSFGNNSHASQQEIYDATKLFSLKLRELIGEVRTTIEEQMKQCSEYIENPPWGDSDMWQSRLDGMAQIHGLLDEAGGGK